MCCLRYQFVLLNSDLRWMLQNCSQNCWIGCYILDPFKKFMSAKAVFSQLNSLNYAILAKCFFSLSWHIQNFGYIWRSYVYGRDWLVWPQLHLCSDTLFNPIPTSGSIFYPPLQRLHQKFPCGYIPVRTLNSNLETIGQVQIVTFISNQTLNWFIRYLKYRKGSLIHNGPNVHFLQYAHLLYEK